MIDTDATEAAAAAKTKAPFFILGCVRSGTTMLRNVLRMHPHLACPEETHLYRWAEPYGTHNYRHVVSNNTTLKRHREMDGISEAEFAAMLEAATSRAELYRRYMALFMSRKKPGATRWFDKTPQNVYGAALAASMPGTRFVHIVRNPENIVASLRLGKVMKVADLVGAVNYWNEAVDILHTLKRAYSKRVYELRYEDFVQRPEQELKNLLAFLGEPYDPEWFKAMVLTEANHTESGILTPEEQSQVRALCSLGRRRYGYEPRAAGEPEDGSDADPALNDRAQAKKAARAARKERPQDPSERKSRSVEPT
jgi:hypothetical protein